ESAAISQSIATNQTFEEFTRIDQKLKHLYVLPLHDDPGVIGAMAVLHDASFIDAQSARLWRDTFERVLAQTIFIAAATLLIIRFSITRPIVRTAHWIRDLRGGKRVDRPAYRSRNAEPDNEQGGRRNEN